MQLSASILIFIGALFCFFAAVGILRMPDFFSRLQVVTKATTLGVGLCLLGVTAYFQDIEVGSKSLISFLFILLTNPVSAHLLARGAYMTGVGLSKETLFDDLEKKYDLVGHHLTDE